MVKIDDLRNEFSLPPLSQVGVVVRDVEKTAQFYSSLFGIGPFKIYEFTPDHYWYHGVETHFRQKQGKAMLGEVELELMQPLEGPSPFMDFLKARGEGLQHIAFNVANYDEVYDRLVKAGFDPVLRVESWVDTYQGHLRASCFDTERIGGVMFEIFFKSWLMHG